MSPIATKSSTGCNHDVGAAVLIFDYRGYGRSEGKPNEPGILRDARAARAWLAQREGIAEKRHRPDGPVARRGGRRGSRRPRRRESPDPRKHVHVAARGGVLPLRRPACCAIFSAPQLDSASKIGQYHGPLLQTHGDADTIVPYAMGRRLFEAANEPKEFVTIKGGDHNDLMGAEYYRRLARFVDGLPAG